jgi:branched-subunit amino acid ABC-type transport system permease component
VELTAVAIQLLNGLAFSMLLFLLAAGLTVIFGIMDFMNLAHGSFYMLGAYLGFTIVDRTRLFWPSLVLAPLVVGVIAYAVDAAVLRRVYRRGHLDQVLLTFGIALMVADIVRWIWGGSILGVPQPDELRGAQSLGLLTYPRYRLFVIGMGLFVALLLWYGQERTRIGAIVRAGVDDRQLVAGLGINITRVSSLVFAGGAALAAFAGVIAGPFLSLQPGMDFETLIYSLIVVVVGGLGTLKGSFVAAILVGLADTFGKIWIPDFSLMLIFAIMALVLLVRPRGLFGRTA